jgi:uncharacterized protein (DUF58 family)
VAGLPFGSAKSRRRGRGSDLAGFRSYLPGDPVSTIDWRASAKASTARGDDEFIVRERFADEAPQVVVVADRTPSMSLYPSWSPWLSKPNASLLATRAVVESAIAARGSAGYVDAASRPDGAAGPFWLPPRTRSPLDLIERRVLTAPYDAGSGSLVTCLEHLSRAALALGSGSFVFVVSDFLDPPPDELWLAGLARRWELVPVVIQDRTWEQSFPSVGPVVMPVVDPRDATRLEVRLRRSEAQAERARREQAHAELLARFAGFGLDPVLLDDESPSAVTHAFLTWAEWRRRALWQRR